MVDVPVLIVVGDRDRLFCTDLPCSSPAGGAALEETYWPNTCVQVITVPATGHSTSLSTTAPRLSGLANAWSGRDDAGRCDSVTLPPDDSTP